MSQELQDDCPYNKVGRHYFTNSVAAGVKADFEPTSYGDSATDTLYKRVEYSMMACNCGVTRKTRVVV